MPHPFGRINDFRSKKVTILLPKEADLVQKLIGNKTKRILVEAVLWCRKRLAFNGIVIGLQSALNIFIVLHEIADEFG